MIVLLIVLSLLLAVVIKPIGASIVIAVLATLALPVVVAALAASYALGIVLLAIGIPLEIVRYFWNLASDW